MDITLCLSSSSSSSSSSNSVFQRLAYTSFLTGNSNAKANSLLLKKKTRIGSIRSKGLSCKAFFGLGVPELAVIAGVAVLLFGPKKLPEVGRSIGKTIKGFQQAAKEFESEIKKEPDSTEENPAEKPTAVREPEEQDIKVSSTKDSV